MNKGFNLSTWAIGNRSLILYFMLVISLAGAWCYTGLGRGEDPSFTIKTMVVVAQWPGATIEETLKQVTERIERKLQETPHLDYVKSYTQAGVTTIFVTLQGSAPKDEVPDIWYQVRKKVGDIKDTLPQGTLGPWFNDEFGDTYGIVYGFTSDGFSSRELRDQVEDIRSRLLQIPDVSKIEMLGVQDERIYVEFSSDQIAGLGLDKTSLIAALMAQNAIAPAGVVETSAEKILVRTSGGFKSEKDILAVNFAANGRLIRLGDIAKVTRGPSDPPQPLFRVNGKEGIGLAISMRDGGDVLVLGENIRAAMAAITADLPVGIETHEVADQAATVEHAVGEFTEALWEAIGIVLIVSVVSLGFRAGSIVALSIPLVLAIVFIAMQILGIDLQRISLGALIIALGLLVDDAMITIESMITRLERGESKEAAASFAYRSTAYPRLAGTLVTIAGFVPIGFAKSMAGEYTFSIFAVVGIALIASWFVAALFSPLLGVWILKAPKGAHHEAGNGPILRAFRGVLTAVMTWRWATIGVTLLVLAVAVYGMRFVPEQFFPSSDRPELLVDLKLPQNASIEASRDISARIDKMLAEDDDVEHFSTYVGRGAVRFYLPMDLQLPNDFFAQSVVVTKGLAERDRVKAKVERALTEDFPNVIGRVYPLELGPPVGWPIQYRVSGPSEDKVREIAFRVAAAMNADGRVQKINYDWMEPVRTLQIHVDQDQARLLGLSSLQVSQAINATVSGGTVTQVRDDIYLVNVVIRAKADERMSLSTIRTLQVPLQNGKSVPLSQVARVDYGLESPLMWRRDRRPTLTIEADTAPGAMPASVVEALSGPIQDISASLPQGYRIDVGGAVEESGKSQASVMAVVPLMLLLMVTILMVQLRSFNGVFMVLSVAPLGVIGVVMALFVAQKPLGFVAMLGILALVGMIARNSVILIDQIEQEKRAGLDPWNAVIEAAVVRFRPILLTASAAILGMIPIAPTIFWGPMAFAIIGGLAGATVLTLLFLPALYVAWHRIRPVPAIPVGQAEAT
ncbi:ACR family transporter [Pleomorphomonas diazotrophica]|uniref:ACR family transporter n=1 Tax=Pleomorphomonas diazotrophica TaxID=1166257 RepID=A0A1I4VF14_9HYPH|nr:efflux RND transporter permease subunit [Pleomorphomonas diazotrophica]PKR90059.1 ACR family transporter [Pleomorphomonas diazotrophica]SFM99781.1 Multidrug efflux pump subunit AcrB [Pleomorphomonas diazotrophica]